MWDRSTGGRSSSLHTKETHEPAHRGLINVVIDGDDGGVDMRLVHDNIETALHMRTLYDHSCNAHMLATAVAPNCSSNVADHDGGAVASAAKSHPMSCYNAEDSTDALYRWHSFHHKHHLSEQQEQEEHEAGSVHCGGGVTHGVNATSVASPDALPLPHRKGGACAFGGAHRCSSDAELTCDDGVFRVGRPDERRAHDKPRRTYEEFIQDMRQLKMTVAHEVCVRACAHRLGIIQERSRLAFLRNTSLQQGGHHSRRLGAAPARVDTCVQLSACVDAGEVARYAVHCAARRPHAQIRLRNGVYTTLGRLLEAGGIRHVRELSCEGAPWWMAEQQEYEHEEDSNEDQYDDEEEEEDDMYGVRSDTSWRASSSHGGRCSPPVEAGSPAAARHARQTGRADQIELSHPHAPLACTGQDTHASSRLRNRRLLSARALHAELCFTFLHPHGSLSARLLNRWLVGAAAFTPERNNNNTNNTPEGNSNVTSISISSNGREAAEYGIPFYSSHSQELPQLATRLHQTRLSAGKPVRWVLWLRPMTRAPVCDTRRGPLPRYTAGSTQVVTVQDQLHALFAPMFRATRRQAEQQRRAGCACGGEGGTHAGFSAAPPIAAQERVRYELPPVMTPSAAAAASNSSLSNVWPAPESGGGDEANTATAAEEHMARMGHRRMSGDSTRQGGGRRNSETSACAEVAEDGEGPSGARRPTASPSCGADDDAVDALIRRCVGAHAASPLQRDRPPLSHMCERAARLGGGRVGGDRAEDNVQHRGPPREEQWGNDPNSHGDYEDEAMMAFMQQLAAIQVESIPRRVEAEVPVSRDTPAHTRVTFHNRHDPKEDRDDAALQGDEQSQSHEEKGVGTAMYYYYYYIHANLSELNRLRRCCGLHTIQLRAGCHPRAGINDLCAAYLLADVVTRASKLAHYPVLQYLCGLHGIGLTVSPLADHLTGAVPYAQHPLPHFLQRGLHVTLATEAPLYFHNHPHSALTEEYATARRVMRLSGLDVDELAYHSVRMSSFAQRPCGVGEWGCAPASVSFSCVSAASASTGASASASVSTTCLCSCSSSSPLSVTGARGCHRVAGETRQTTRDKAPAECDWALKARLRFRSRAWQMERDMLRHLHLDRGLMLSSGTMGGGSGGGEGVAVTTATTRRRRWLLSDDDAQCHYFSPVEKVDYSVVVDSRVRFARTILSRPLTPHRVPWRPETTAHRAPNGSGGVGRRRRHDAAVSCILRALELRQRYGWLPPRPWETSGPNRRGGVEADFQTHTESFREDAWRYTSSDAVYMAFPAHAVHTWPSELPTLEAYYAHVETLKKMCGRASVKDLACNRLAHLDHMFSLHLALNHANEAGTTACRASSNRDIYQATKVDTHIHMAAGMTPRQMLRFVLQKLRDSSDDIARKTGDEVVTLGELFVHAGITDRLTVDQLNVQADHTLFERFDNFNGKYNPMGNAELRSLLLKTDNFMNGRYFAEMIREVFGAYSRDRHTFAENRLSIYGANLREWDKLSSWFVTHGMSDKHNRWIIQIPRVYKVFRAQKVIGSFGQYLQNLFQPLWEASLHPAQHPTLHNFLNHISGFDSVDDESATDAPFRRLSPWEWTLDVNPPYNYYIYYLYANIRTLNTFRALRGFSTFTLRPHCGESGSGEHLYGAFLCANSISHGINLRHDPVMEYLYYLTRIGLHMSPLSNNALFLRFLNNPFPQFFRRGLNVSLSTDDPMMFHQTHEPLIEEYSIAARVWGLSANDLCELARNSVLQSGFDDAFKRERIGARWYMSSSLGNDPLKTHLSDIRVAFRYETYHTELGYLHMYRPHPHRAVPRFMMTIAEEREIYERDWTNMECEPVIRSTYDQAMEIMQRDMERTGEQIAVYLRRVDAARRQQRLLLDNITDVGMRRKEAQNELDRLGEKRWVRRLRYPPSSSSPAPLASASASISCSAEARQWYGSAWSRSTKKGDDREEESEPHALPPFPARRAGLGEACDDSHGACRTQQGEMTRRLLRWTPMPTRHVLSTLRCGHGRAGSPAGRPLPALPAPPYPENT